jgi:hypothetical protein
LEGLPEIEAVLAISDALGIERSEIPQSQSLQESELLLPQLMPHVPPELKDSGTGPIHGWPFLFLPNLTQQFLQCPDVIGQSGFHGGGANGVV